MQVATPVATCQLPVVWSVLCCAVLWSVEGEVEVDHPEKEWANWPTLIRFRLA